MKHYTQEEIDAIEKLMKTAKNRVMYRKFLVVHLHMGGYSNRKIAGIIGINKGTVGSYINTYNSGGPDGLIPKKQPGRPKFLDEDQEHRLHETIKGKSPDDVGFDGVMAWTARIACIWAKNEFGVQYQVNGMLELFHRLNLSYTRPTYVLAKADPEKQEQFRKDFEEVKKNC
jgi:putative transposase